jgi:hypothetical protein
MFVLEKTSYDPDLFIGFEWPEERNAAWYASVEIENAVVSIDWPFKTADQVYGRGFKIFSCTLNFQCVCIPMGLGLV